MPKDRKRRISRPRKSAAPAAPAPAQGSGKRSCRDIAARLLRRLPDGAAVWGGFRFFGGGVLTRTARQNPVLVRALAICTVLAAATALKNGLLLSVAAIAVMVPLTAAMALLHRTPLQRIFPPFLWPAVTLAVAGALTTPVCWLSYRAAPNVTAAVGIFLPLTALNATLMTETIRPVRRGRMLSALTASVGDAAGFSVSVILIAALREIIGKGTLYARPIFGHGQFGFLLTPAGAFLLLGCLMAVFQWARRRWVRQKGREGR